MGETGTGAVERAPDAEGIIDTDILVDAHRRVEAAQRFLEERRVTMGLTISIVSAMELVIGCQNAQALATIREFLQHCRTMPITTTISQRAYGLIELFFLSHGLLIPDSLIAVTALEYDWTLYTKNVRHFRMIPGLRVIRPY